MNWLYSKFDWMYSKHERRRFRRALFWYVVLAIFVAGVAWSLAWFVGNVRGVTR